MKVLINAISVRTGGGETFLTSLLPNLAQCLPALEFVLLVRQSRAWLYSGPPNNVEVRAIPDSMVGTPAKRLVFEHLQVPGMHRGDLFDVHFQVDEMLSPIVTLRRVPSLAVFHTTPMVLFGNVTGDGYLFERYARLIRWHTARCATMPVTVSFHARAELSGLFPFARDRFRVVYHGVDRTRYSPGPQKINPLSPYGIQAPYLLSISNRFVWKNYYRLIQAYHKLIFDRRMDYDLVLIGKAKLAAEEQRIARYLTQHHLTERVHLIDYIEQDALPDVYRGACAYIFPSMRETFGLTVLEAMACGVPVACARWGPLPEVAGDAAYYFDPLSTDDMATAMLAVATDETIGSELSQRGLAHVRFFTWERAAEEYHRLILGAAEQ